MTQEDKELLLKDLSARLPYGVIVDIKYNKEHGSSDRLRICSEGSLMLNADLINLCIEKEIHLKPYLRPMSSMTEEEEKKFLCISNQSPGYLELIIQINSRYDIILPIESFDWLNAHHFDYRNLITKELAIEAPEGMYSLK